MRNKKLSKTNYMLYLNCRKELWLEKNIPDVKSKDASIVQQYRYDEGYVVEEMAHNLFPVGVLIKGIYEDGAKETDSTSSNVIYQATAMTEQLIAKADILVSTEADNAKEYDLYEVKQSTSVKSSYVDDLAFQKVVFEKAGYKIRYTYLIHVNNQYVKDGDIVPEQILLVNNISERVDEIVGQTEENIQNALNYIQGAQPEVNITLTCDKKLDCPFIQHFYKNVPKLSVFNIPYIMNSKRRLEQLLERNIIDIYDIPSSFQLSEKQREYVDAIQSGGAVIQKDMIKSFLEKLKYPLFFLDYEAFNPAIPWYDGFKPYQFIVFQYSLHVQESVDSEVDHFEFLSKEATNPTLRLLQQLQKDIVDSDGSVVVWHKSFETKRHQEMSKLYPEYGEFLNSLNERVFDLEDAFSKRYYIHPGFKGSSSLKNVLPVLVPDLTYSDKPINEGELASIKWSQMVRKEVSEEEQSKIYQDLLDYCKLDTYSMVRILNILQAV